MRPRQCGGDVPHSTLFPRTVLKKRTSPSCNVSACCFIFRPRRPCVILLRRRRKPSRARAKRVWGRDRRGRRTGQRRRPQRRESSGTVSARDRNTATCGSSQQPHFQRTAQSAGCSSGRRFRGNPVAHRPVQHGGGQGQLPREQHQDPHLRKRTAQNHRPTRPRRARGSTYRLTRRRGRGGNGRAGPARSAASQRTAVTVNAMR